MSRPLGLLLAISSLNAEELVELEADAPPAPDNDVNVSNSARPFIHAPKAIHNVDRTRVGTSGLGIGTVGRWEVVGDRLGVRPTRIRPRGGGQLAQQSCTAKHVDWRARDACEDMVEETGKDGQEQGEEDEDGAPWTPTRKVSCLRGPIYDPVVHRSIHVRPNAYHRLLSAGFRRRQSRTCLWTR
jgi:hypothetical protein